MTGISRLGGTQLLDEVSHAEGRRFLCFRFPKVLSLEQVYFMNRPDEGFHLFVIEQVFSYSKYDFRLKGTYKVPQDPLVL